MPPRCTMQSRRCCKTRVVARIGSIAVVEDAACCDGRGSSGWERRPGAAAGSGRERQPGATTGSSSRAGQMGDYNKESDTRCTVQPSLFSGSNLRTRFGWASCGSPPRELPLNACRRLLGPIVVPAPHCAWTGGGGKPCSSSPASSHLQSRCSPGSCHTPCSGRHRDSRDGDLRSTESENQLSERWPVGGGAAAAAAA